MFVSIFGMINTLVLSVYERTREIGMLRAIGMTRRQVRRMIRQESVITALIGAALGLPLGIFLAALVNRALSEFDVRFSIPWAQLVDPHRRRDRDRDPRRDHAGAPRGEVEPARSHRLRVAWRDGPLRASSGLLSRKLRTALTAIAIVLGVAMISGTYVLTDSIDQAFDRIFTDIRKGSNAVISGKSAVDLSDQSGVSAPDARRVAARRRCARSPASPRPRAASTRMRRSSSETTGRRSSSGGAPNLGFSIAERRLGLQPAHAASRARGRSRTRS